MKKLFLVLFVFSIGVTFAQVPKSFSYRGAVYDENGSLFAKQNIKVSVRIIEEEDIEAESVYEETHEVVTNTRGSFYLSIGEGVPNGSFNDIDDAEWTTAEKYLHIIVRDESDNIMSNGISQLMSVPYALVAGRTIEGPESIVIGEYANVNALRNNIYPDDGTLAYVKGHTHGLDNGGGHFIFKADDDSEDDNGMIIDPGDGESEKPGRWFRHNYREVSVAYYGARPNLATDQTDAFQKAIDFVDENGPGEGGGIVYVPKGRYYVTQLVLKSFVSIRGEYAGTEIRPIKNGSDWENSILKLEEGKPVINVEIKDITFQGEWSETGEADMHCFAFNSTLGGEGGLWESSFRNIKIRGFKKDGIRFQGGLSHHPDSSSVNQFITMENVRILKSKTNSSSRALYLHGQNGQFSFINCTFSSPKNLESLPGTNVEIHGKANNGPVVRPKSSVINFYTCTFEEANLGILASEAHIVNINGCWFENLNNGLFVTNNSLGVNVTRSRFSNAAVEDALHYIYNIQGNSVGTFKDNLLRGDYPPSNYLVIGAGSSLTASGTIEE